MDRLNELFAIPDPAEFDAIEQTVAVVRSALRTGAPLPPAEEVRRLTVGVSVTDVPTVGEWYTAATGVG